MTAFEPWVKNVDTASISDAADSLGLRTGWLSGISPRVPGTRFIGRAFTVRYRLLGDPGTGFRNAANFIDAVPEGSVIVSVNPTGVACTTWGDLLTTTARARGIAGTVVCGFARDIEAVRQLGYPLFSSGVSMVSAKNRIELDAVQQAVDVDGVPVEPGDLVVGDDNGVMVIPAKVADIVLQRALSVEEVERDISRAVRGGLSLESARAEFGYATPWERSAR